VNLSGIEKGLSCSLFDGSTQKKVNVKWDMELNYFLMSPPLQMRHEIQLFLKTMSPLSSHFEDYVWLCQLAYLTELFTKLNDLDLNLHCDRNETFSAACTPFV
jgi:hypothetical protein